MELGVLVWLGIAACISQSAMFSGMNLALFAVSRLRLESEAAAGDADAVRMLDLRRDANLTLSTILWGNVGANVLLALLSNSVLSGVSAFLFSTIFITVAGEIVPQGYCSRHAMQISARFAPMLRFYRLLLFPLAKPSALLLDVWIGPEGIQYYRESELRKLIMRHVAAPETDVDHVEGIGALNFLAMDDIAAIDEGEPVDPRSVLPIGIDAGKPVWPDFERQADDPFLRKIDASGKKWIVLLDDTEKPVFALNSDGFLRDALFGGKDFRPDRHIHRPIVVSDPKTLLGDVVRSLKFTAHATKEGIIDEDLILVWTDRPRVITGADLLGRLFRGIALAQGAPPTSASRGSTATPRRSRWP